MCATVRVVIDTISLIQISDTVQISNIDTLATADDTDAALTGKTGVKIDVSAVAQWRRRDEMQQARIRLSRYLGQQINGETVVIGYTRCTIRELEAIPTEARRCFRCLERSHRNDNDNPTQPTERSRYDIYGPTNQCATYR